MKYMVFVLAGVVLTLTACIRKQVVLEVSEERDSLAQVVAAKDSLVNAVFEDINSISANLAQIRSREHLIVAVSDDEGGRRPVEEIAGDIAAIDRLLQENRAKIASLEYTAARLRKADVRIDALGKTIADLHAQLNDKTASIELLRDELAMKTTEVERLHDTVAMRTAAVDRLNDEKATLEERLHAVYYVVGPERELRDAQIIDKQGFIGRTLTFNARTGQSEAFTQADARLLTEVPVGHRKATVVTPHPAETYELVVGDDRVVEKLVVTDPDRFWEASKILVISYR